MSDRNPGMMEAVEAIGAKLLDPWWRISSGVLYKIMTKNDENQPASVVPFIPNVMQTKLLTNLWHRNVVPKARQHGITTCVQIAWLDHALWNADQRCVTIAHAREDAEKIFRDKVRFAYDRLPEVLRMAFPLADDNKSELRFAHNNSAVRVTVSARSSTSHRLHVSELSTLDRDRPTRAHDVMEGSLPAVPASGITILESTIDIPSGRMADTVRRAKELADRGAPLSPLDFRLHFFAWHDNPEYRTDPEKVVISPTEHQYFDDVETAARTKISLPQRAFYISKRDGDFAGNVESMWRQYPSTLDEVFQRSAEGVYYAQQLARARMEGRIGTVPVTTAVPVNTFWDIGSNDGTGIWLHQHVGGQDRFLAYFEGWFEGFEAFVAKLDDFANKRGPLAWGRHFLPHDADSLRQQGASVISPRQMLEQLKPGWAFEVVPRVRDLNHGIQQTRAAFSAYWFDAEGCKEGLAHLASYRRKFNDAVGGWMDEPVKDVHTEAADALRQHAQGWTNPTVAAGARPKRSRLQRRFA